MLSWRLDMYFKAFLIIVWLSFFYSCSPLTNGEVLPLTETSLDLSLLTSSRIVPISLQVGVAKQDISPKMSSDGNPIWLAGYYAGRQATGIHDPIWARVIWLSDGTVRIAWVALDLIGYPLGEVQAIRRLLKNKDIPVDYVMVTSTHTHAGPDTLGLWGGFNIFSGVDPAYINNVNNAVVAAVTQAQNSAIPAVFSVASFATGKEGFFRDSNTSLVIDDTCTALRFRSVSSKQEIATVVIWGNHSEVLSSSNTLLSSDYPHALRQTVEEGFPGTTGLFFAGSVGNMTPLNVEVKDTSGKVLPEASFEKMQRLGSLVGQMVVNQLKSIEKSETSDVLLKVRARTVDLAVENEIFMFLAKLGTVNRGLSPDGKIRTEISVIRIGDIWLLGVPGELYPELFVGGIAPLPGGKFPDALYEEPPLKTFMRGKVNAVIGLANDEVGYIIPKVQWRSAEIFETANKDGYLHETNSVGPNTAPDLYHGFVDLLKEDI